MAASHHSTCNPLIISFPAEVHEMLSQAATRLGVSLNGFILEAAADRAREILEGEGKLRLSRQDAALFFETLEAPPAPNAALRDAKAACKDLIRE